MKELLLLLCMLFYLVGCKETHHLEYHKAEILDVQHAPTKGSEYSWLVVWRDEDTDEVVSERVYELPPPKGTRFRKEVWVPIVK